MEDKLFLINLLKLTSYVLEKDKEESLKIAEEFNKVELSQQQQIQLKESILSLMDNIRQYPDILKGVISILTSLNQKYLLAILEIKTTNFYNTSSVKEMVTSKLEDTEITFDNPHDKYVYYQMLCNLTINLKDVQLIKLAIDKIQDM